MGLTTAYLVNAKDLERFLNALRAARAPDKMSLRFLEDLGFKSTNHRLFIPLLKALRFLDENGVPTQRYFRFLDDGQWKQVLAEGVQDAYEDLFRLNRKAYSLPRTDVMGKLKSLTEGKKSEAVIDNMTRTFLELVKLSDFDSTPSPPASAIPDESASPAPGVIEGDQEQLVASQKSARLSTTVVESPRLIDAITYRIEIVLPAARDKSVYDAIFRSLKEHLL